MPYDTIIFDCDGTLSRSDEAYYHGLHDALIRYGFPAPSVQEYQERYSGRVFEDILAAYSEDTGQAFPPEVTDYYYELEHPYQIKFTHAVEGAFEAIDLLAARHKLCVASNASVAGIEFLLGRSGLMGKFAHEHLFSRDHVARPKPAPDIFLYAAREMGSDPARCIVVEDSGGGVRAGAAAGMTVIGFTGTAPHPEEKAALLQRSGATAVFNTWPEIVAYIESIA